MSQRLTTTNKLLEQRQHHEQELKRQVTEYQQQIETLEQQLKAYEQHGDGA